ncbi:type II secretion system inner membrane protein GspF, partial [Roseateles sp. GG27B]
MPAYKYEAITAAGRSSSGLIEADTPRAARALLRAQGQVPLT